MAKHLLALLVLVTCLISFTWYSPMAQEEASAQPETSEQAEPVDAMPEGAATTDTVEVQTAPVAEEDKGPFIDDPNKPGLVRGDVMVWMLDGTKKPVNELKEGDELMHLIGIPIPKSATMSLSPQLEKMINERRDKFYENKSLPKNKVVMIEKVKLGQHPTTKAMWYNSDNPNLSTATIILNEQGWAAFDAALAEMSLLGKRINKVKELDPSKSVFDPLSGGYSISQKFELPESPKDNEQQIFYRITLDKDGFMLIDTGLENRTLLLAMPTTGNKQELPSTTGREYKPDLLRGIPTMLVCKPRVANRSMLVVYIDKINDRAMFADYVRVKMIPDRGEFAGGSPGVRFNIETGEFMERIGFFPPTDCEDKNLKDMK